MHGPPTLACQYVTTGADLLGSARVVDDELAHQVRGFDQVGGFVPEIKVTGVPAVTSAVIIVAVAVCNPWRPP